jgi:hypothetical protein
MKTYDVDVNMSRTPKEGAYSSSRPNRLIIIIIGIIIIVARVSNPHSMLTYFHTLPTDSHSLPTAIGDRNKGHRSP